MRSRPRTAISAVTTSPATSPAPPRRSPARAGSRALRLAAPPTASPRTRCAVRGGRASAHQPRHMRPGPGSLAGKMPAEPQQQRQNLLAFRLEIVDRGLARPHQIPHRFVPRSGTQTAVSSPARNSLARLTASRRLVFTRSPGFLGISDGATTTHSWPSILISRYSPYPSARPHSRTSVADAASQASSSACSSPLPCSRPRRGSGLRRSGRSPRLPPHCAASRSIPRILRYIRHDSSSFVRLYPAYPGNPRYVSRANRLNLRRPSGLRPCGLRC